MWFTEGIQAIFQDPFGTFNPLRTIDRYFFETVKQSILVENREAAIELIDQKLHAVGLSYQEFSGMYPGKFSGGQLQRISISRSLLTDLIFIIKDAPVSMVDVSLRMMIAILLKKIKDDFGVSVLVSCLLYNEDKPDAD